MSDISTGMKVTGLSQWKSAFSQAQTSVKTLDAELKKAEAQYKATGDKEQYLADKSKTLQKQLEAQKKAAKTAEEWRMPPEMADLYLFMAGGVIRRYMECALDYLDREYGGPAGYLEKEIGIDREKRERLQAKYLTREEKN